MLLALLLLACSGAVDPVDSVVDTGTDIPQCCEFECEGIGGTTLIHEPPDGAGPDWCQDLADGSCPDGVVEAESLDEC